MPQVIFGMVGGVIAGFVLGCTKLFDNKYKRLIGIYGAGACRAGVVAHQSLCGVGCVLLLQGSCLV
jgi:hypothetical protein